MKKYSIFIVILLCSTCANARAAGVGSTGRGIVEDQIRERTPLDDTAKKEKIFFNAYYEYGWVQQGFRKGNWQLSTGRFAYSINDMMTPYLAFNTYERFTKKDYTIDTGYDFRFDKTTYGNAELSVGADVDYMYRYRTNLSYGHKLYKNLCWEINGRYMNYKGNDVGLASPALIYYFGNHYVSAAYGVSLTHTRGAAQWGVFKGTFALNDDLHLSGGMAHGQRLYDIYEIDASKQLGYIFFAGLDYNLVKNLNARIGYSYSKERPNWQKHSMDFSLNLKF
ncbi:MAG: YaiO family outer membrane beta-barrel protein [Candidatus Omnitrophica bacterium]|nr:YaiO family outer membrane beta-barrel protein [Candidatus Omnitrophota bacterium]